MKLADNVIDIGLFPVLLKAHIDNVDGIALFTVFVDSATVYADLELLEHFPA